MNKDIVYAYVQAINEHNIQQLYELMSEDFCFIDTYAVEIHGRESMKDGWIGYFAWFPDYHIDIREVFSNDTGFMLLGFASGTYQGIARPDKKNYWRLPAAWKIEINNDEVKLWQVICDSKIPMETMNVAAQQKVTNANPPFKEVLS